MGNALQRITRRTANGNTNTSQPEEVETPVDWKAIHSAIRWNKVDDLIPLLSSKAAVNCKDEKNGNCPIHIAAQNGHLNIVKILVEKSADLNAQNNKGNTALHMALSYDYYDCAKYLIDSGAILDIRNSSSILAKNGIEGDKSVPTAAFIAAKTTSDLLAALTLCNVQLSELEKSKFASLGLKVKKSVGDNWSEEVQEKFKTVLDSL